ncbi:hypothetical protein [Sphingomonas ginkgonis]|nr:hypothetical protein [Sphingomonas ginkgonis]
MALGAGSAFADTNAVPPGQPCSKNNGNPCNGNNGNLGSVGNAHGHARISNGPLSIEMTMPSVAGRTAYVDQVGDSQVVTIVQEAPNATASVTQSGTHNEADVRQAGSGNAALTATQAGSGNFARLAQSGSGDNLLVLTQSGANNWAFASQNATGVLFNGAKLSQSGNDNDLSLAQNGSDNRAVLTQEGSGNGMTATQNGDGNRLMWAQKGNNLADLNVVQSGGSVTLGQLSIIQTGAGH